MGLAVSAFAGEIRKSYPQLIVPKKSPKVYWIKIAKMLESASITKEDAFKVGAWLSRQKWLREPVTVMTAAMKAGEWLAKATAQDSRPGRVKEPECVDLTDLEI